MGRTIKPWDQTARNYSEQELNAYQGLTASLKIEDATSGDMRFEIHCPSIRSVADLSKLSATVRFISPVIGIGGGGLSGPVVPAILNS
ncbi:hypothetical protein BYZ73_11465 [Rhodovulum viride]|uniref:Uncharacterized protein n=1 Tax=Rhodovulum viride TaxID=1231134 RepID=A0ABX9DFB9_9RHOB|nr:hypothetical protein [Rhodovulum viride]RAP41050.1 hypothetical protein BYZ73_11465 [Rhodovulum viride]